MNGDQLPLYNLLLAPLVAGSVVGAWVATGRLFVARMGGVRLPVWIPWVVTPVAVVAGLVVIASQVIAASASLVAQPSAERGAAALIAVLLSPVWTGSAALAVLGLALHYSLDGLLALLHLHPLVQEGLALGIRAAWATVGLLVLFFGLQTAYVGVAGRFHATVYDVVNGDVFRVLIDLVTVGLALFGMAAPALIERRKRPPQASANPADAP